MPAVYISKYNRFVDNILGRINRILGKSYDPVRVRLQSNQSKKNKNNKNNSSQHKKSKGKKRKNSSKNRRQAANGHLKNKMGELVIARGNTQESGKRSTESESREPAFILISKNSPDTGKVEVKNISTLIENRMTESTTIGKKAKTNKSKSKTKSKKNKTKQQTGSTKPPKARATLFGLSSLRRSGDVEVNMVADHTTVKTNFVLGPLTLRVEREIGRGAKRELKSATATTAEMLGKLNLRIVHGGAATLHSIRVLQPKQVRVDSADNHEKTKEFLWKRSSHIASMVSQKLASAARSMLKPPPKSMS